MTITAKVREEGISLKALSKDELHQLCKEHGLTNLKCDIVYYRLLEELSHKEIYKLLGYSKARYFELKNKIKTNPIFHEI